MAKTPLPQRKRLAAIFASFTILIMGTASLMQSMSFDYYSVLGTLSKVIPSAFILGCLGWVMGMILDKPKKSHRIPYSTSLLNDLLKNQNLNEGFDIGGEIKDDIQDNIAQNTDNESGK